MATGTITEDIQTSVRLHSHGWSSYFVNEPLAYGIAPETVQAFLVQRLRWANGTMQLYRGHDSPLWIKGLSLRQRISYLSSFLAYFEAFQKLILILTPAIIILFSVFPMSVGMQPFLLRWLPYFAIAVAANVLGGRGYFRYFQTEKYNLLKMVVFIQSTVTLIWRKPLAFQVTPKSLDLSVYRKERRSLRAYFVILGCISGDILVGLIQIRSWTGLTLDRQLYLIALVWATYNAAIILNTMTQVLSIPHARKDYRFRVSLEGALFEENNSVPIAPAHVRDLSVSGVGFDTNCRIASDRSKLQLRVDIPGQKQVTLPLSRVKQRTTESDKTYVMGASLLELGEKDREQLFEYLFISTPGKRLAHVIEDLQKHRKSTN